MLSASSPALGQLLSPLAGPSPQPPPPWRYAGLPNQKPPATRYGVGDVEGRRALRVEAAGSYGNLVHPLNGAAGELSWRWRVDQPLAGADLRTKAGDDTALKVCAMFDMPRALVPFVERQLLKLAESRLGEALPTATLCYVWDPSLAPDTVLSNAYSRRLRWIALGGTPGRWEVHRRDLAKDFLRAFGEESAAVPPLLAIAVGADADNTGSRSVGWIDSLEHHTAP